MSYAMTSMGSVDKVLHVAEAEMNVDPRKVGVRAVSQILPQHAFNRVRTVLLRAMGIRISAATSIAGTLKITGSGSVPKLLSIGPGCYLTGPIHIDLMDAVRIGARVYMGYDVMLITADHEVGPSAQRCGPSVNGAIEIGDGVWIGSRAVVLPGVRIGHGSVVAAGAVVTKDVAPNTMVAGVPARFVRDLDEEACTESGRRARLSTAPPNGHPHAMDHGPEAALAR
jgi:maltose O-acetyltransferase